MLSIEQLDLAHLPIESIEFGVDPMPYFAEARLRHAWLATSNIGHVITEYRAMDEILRMDAKLKMPGEDIVEIMGAHGTGWGQFAQDMMLARSGEDHARLRGSVSKAFGPGNVKRLRPVMRATVTALLDEWAPKCAFDFAEFAANFPVRVMFGLIGGSIDKLPDIMSSLEVHGASFNMEVENMAKIETAYQKLWTFADETIKERGPGGTKGDLLDDLIAATVSGDLNEVEVRQLLILLFAAGYDTSKNVLTLLMHSMIQAPDVWRRCATDADYCKKVVKEQMRFASPSSTYRVVTDEFDFRDVRFAKGGMLIFPLAISGRDQGVFNNPMVFDPERADRAPNLSFGRGMHICLGQFLAQANVEEGTHLIAQRLTNPRLTAAVTWRRFPGVWGIEKLPMAFDAQAEPARDFHEQ